MYWCDGLRGCFHHVRKGALGSELMYYCTPGPSLRAGCVPLSLSHRLHITARAPRHRWTSSAPGSRLGLAPRLRLPESTGHPTSRNPHGTTLGLVNDRGLGGPESQLSLTSQPSMPGTRGENCGAIGARTHRTCFVSDGPGSCHRSLHLTSPYPLLCADVAGSSTYRTGDIQTVGFR